MNIPEPERVDNKYQEEFQKHAPDCCQYRTLYESLLQRYNATLLAAGITEMGPISIIPVNPKPNRFLQWLRDRRVKKLRIEIAGQDVKVTQLTIYGKGSNGYLYIDRHMAAITLLAKLRAELDILQKENG